MSLPIIPVTIISGFLGSGKTTLLNQIIQQNPDKKFAIIENEFGAIGIDSDLVITTNENIFELSNGCICCNLNGDLANLLNKLVIGDYNFNHLIIETTGIADPSAVAAIFLTDYNIQSVFKLNGTITLADASQVLSVLGVEQVASKQIAYADYILLNKSSEIDIEQKKLIFDTLSKINTIATIEFCNYAKVETKNILELNRIENPEIATNIKYSLNTSNAHNHIVSQSFIISESLDLLKIRHYLTVMLFVQGAYFYRIKGILHIEGLDRKLIIQSVKDSPVFTDGENWKDEETRETKIVFIGKELKREILLKGMQQCIFKS